MAVGSFMFFNENSTSGTSNEWRVPERVNDLEIQVTKLDPSATVNLVLEGKVDISSDKWVQLTMVSLNGLSTKNAIDGEGIFAASVTNVLRLRMRNLGTTGAVKAFGSVS